MPPTPRAHRAALSAAILMAALATPLLTATAAQADDCKKGNPFGCNWVDRGTGSGGSGGRGSPSGGGASGPVEPPDPEGLTDGEAPGFLQVGGDGPPPPAAPTTLDWVRAAQSAAELPTPTIHTAPSDKTYVRVRTALWVEGFDVVKTQPIGGGGQMIQATATPVSVTWNLGETQKTCNGPGRKDGKTCSHTFRRSSAAEPGGAYKITATITWSLTWTCTGPACDPQGGNLGNETMTSPATPLVVSEIQTNTGQ
ncbi:hypothetical protein SAMN05443665_1006132 [Actinomadura meyerae]|uniref:ATP/GTP-binding protein n=1 Tax=Actinomadura meyerae TaxID=240840 RepID=A0A239FSK6_9ACTN|nr:hypothetical protein [Actinomadura meyerae]SNS59212.1 hypothetical protein SAMN05443665_1006132 [Actinomadura meyerae]